MIVSDHSTVVRTTRHSVVLSGGTHKACAEGCLVPGRSSVVRTTSSAAPSGGTHEACAEGCLFPSGDDQYSKSTRSGSGRTPTSTSSGSGRTTTTGTDLGSLTMINNDLNSVVGSPDVWTRLPKPIIVASGACDSVMPPDWAPNYDALSSGKEGKVTYTAADGEHVPNVGKNGSESRHRRRVI